MRQNRVVAAELQSETSIVSRFCVFAWSLDRDKPVANVRVLRNTGVSTLKIPSANEGPTRQCCCFD